MVRCCRNGSSGCRIGDISKCVPVCGGDHRSMMAPCGNPMKARRLGVEPAGVAAHAVAAGLIASRSGSAMLAPTPFNTVRRETCFLNTYIASLRYPIPAIMPGLKSKTRPTLPTSEEHDPAYGAVELSAGAA